MSDIVKYTAIIIESERGWGQRVDEVKEFDTKAERDAFITSFNKTNNAPVVPDWYMIAQEGQDRKVSND